MVQGEIRKNTTPNVNYSNNIKKIISRNKGYFFILPAVLFMLVFLGYPIIYNFTLSFQDVNVMNISGEKTFVALQNYINLFKDPVFRESLYNTLYFTCFSMALQFVLGFAFALFFNLDFELAKFSRGLLMIAWVLPATVVALAGKLMFTAEGGIINEILIQLNLIKEPIQWLLEPKTAMWSLILTNVWLGIPFNMILLTTGLSTIPKSIYESASLDGANWWHRLVYITIPSIKPAIMAVLMLGFIYTFKVFDLVFVLTKGGPVNSTEVLSTLSYRYSFDQFAFSNGSTVANVLFLILFVVSLLYLKMMGKDEVI